MATPVCTVSSFIAGTPCYQNFNSHQRASIWIYYAAAELEAIGGTDYRDELGSGGQLESDSTCFKNLPGNPFVSPSIYYLLIGLNNAVAAGASVADTNSDLASAIACNQNFPEADLAAQMLLLTCLLGAHATQ